MGGVYDRRGRKVGSVNAWSGVYDASGNKVGSINIFSNNVTDAAGNIVGSVNWHGEAYGASGEFLCKVAFFGSDVKDAHGNLLGSVGPAGAPEPPPDMQWRGAAALLLLCLGTKSREDEIYDFAFDYLSSRSPAKRDQLVRYGAEAMPLLVTALVNLLAERGVSVRSKQDRESIRTGRWSRTIFEPLIVPAVEAINMIGESAVLALCEGLSAFDRRIARAATLLLVLQEDTSSRILAKLRAVLSQVRLDDSVTVMLVTFILANAGDAKAHETISQHAQASGLDVQSWLARTVDTAILELLGWEKEVLT